MIFRITKNTPILTSEADPEPPLTLLRDCLALGEPLADLLPAEDLDPLRLERFLRRTCER